VAEYALSAAAERDLAGIYAYTFGEFGDTQADRYFESIEDCLVRLAANPSLGREVEQIREGYRRLVHRRHSIYYQASGQGIYVVRVLGPGMVP
jgi:toxin ParE1/3/4